MFKNIKNSKKSGFTPTPSFKNKENWVSGFTLIELLVVVAIIGILSGVVIASLNSAREKGKIASIKSTLKNMIAQAEILNIDSTAGNYGTTCTGLQKFMDSITDKGGTPYCYTYNNGSNYIHPSWAVTTLMNTSIPIQAYSSSPSGVTTWQTKGVNSSGVPVDTDVTMPWATANTACATAGGRLPTMEELRALSQASFNTSGSYTPPGFVASSYWSSTTHPADSTVAYYVYMVSGLISNSNKTNDYYVRCVSSS